MKKSSRNQSNRISLLILLPIVAVVIAVPIFLTHLVEAPIGDAEQTVGTDMTADSGALTDSDSHSTNGGAGGDVDTNAADHADGTDDADGADGANGSNGSDGAGGTGGANGSNGADGAGGSNGTDSANDADGLSGADGAGGANGSNGSDGADGTGGADGTQQGQSSALSPEEFAAGWSQSFTLNDVPAYSGELYTVINNNLPFFPRRSDAAESFERYAELDSLGRCGTACANVGQDIMPTEPRGEIGQVRPSGWHTVKYDGIDGNYLYNRSHLIAYQLAGENANVCNLITGTRSFNAVGMLPFEEMVGDYVRETGHHVLYRVTPMFRGNNLVADGVLMEAWSVEDSGAGVCFNVFVYNVQPGIVIDYATGNSYAESDNPAGSDTAPTAQPTADTPTPTPEPASGADYILNTNTHKFHYPYCDSVQEMSERNKLPYSGTREEVIAMGYVPCKRCNP
ncbi:MAG: DNA/RNA non-specific endonuclease [Clostridium sp.]|nr:DNA/RNA non-specific endonuclease [Clostridium sp.]